METQRPHLLVSNPEPDLTCYLRGRLYPHSTHEMLPTCSYRQVKYFRNLVLTILYIGLLTCPTVAYPKPKTRIKEESDKTVTIQVSGCRQQSSDDLRRMMGPAFDESKMAYDDVMNDARTGRDRLKNDNDNDNEAVNNRKRDSFKQSVIVGKGNDDAEEELLENAEEYFDNENELEELGGLSAADSSVDKSSTISVQKRKFMRRRKRDENANSLADTNFLYQNLLYDAVARRTSRAKRSSGGWNHHPLLWECRKKDKWMKMKAGYFPSRIMETKCKQKDCFYGMYTCNPVKYTVRVLRRDPDNACNPVPLIGNSTVYEEVWQFKKIRVTVACECGNSWKAAKRKRNRNMSPD